LSDQRQIIAGRRFGNTSQDAEQGQFRGCYRCVHTGRFEVEDAGILAIADDEQRGLSVFLRAHAIYYAVRELLFSLRKRQLRCSSAPVSGWDVAASKALVCYAHTFLSNLQRMQPDFASAHVLAHSATC
jgi:hypothetical protein